MSKNNTTTCSGKVKRIFVETSDVTTFARFTLEGEKIIHNVTVTDQDIRRKIELTAPGDEIHLNYEETGLIFKTNTVRYLKNITLDKELKNVD